MTRLAIYLRDDFRCAYCRADLSGAHPREMGLDHITPLSRGGTNAATNLVTACKPCNDGRRDDGHAFARHRGVDMRRVRAQARRKLDRFTAIARRVSARPALGRSMTAAAPPPTSLIPDAATERAEMTLLSVPDDYERCER